MRLLTAVLVALVVPAAEAARIEVHLPAGNPALRITDATPPPEGLRIDCPPLCVHTSPGSSVDIFDLRIEPVDDPRTHDRPWDIIAMPGCRGTSALPADNGKCFLPFEGDVDIFIELRYRPILAVTYTGTYGGPLSGLFINGGPGPGYQGSGTSFSCDATKSPQDGRCAAHLSAGQRVQILTSSTVRATLLAVSPPCGGQSCEFVLNEDTCIQYEFKNGDPGLFPTMALATIECPTGPGVSGPGGGGGGGGGGGPEPPKPIPDALEELKAYALQQLQAEFQQVVYPCLVATSGVAVFAATAATGPALSLLVGGGLVAAASPQCASGIKRLHELQTIYNDPPNLDFGAITPIRPTARPSFPLPSCTDVSGSERRVCRRLGKALVKHVAKDERATAVAESLRVTVEKAVGAFEADDDRALKGQLRAAGKRRKQLDAALRARAKAGDRLAAILGGVGTATLTEAEFTDGSAAALGKLGELGLAEADARTLLDPALVPRSLDQLGVLGQP